MKKHFHSNGKLLLTGEYVVLDGAKALAIPTRFGQSMTVEKNTDNRIHWESLDYKNRIWFEHTYEIGENTVLSTGRTNPTAEVLLKILRKAKEMNPEFLSGKSGFRITTRLDFPQNWGLGSSSTLINNIAQWAETDPFELLFSGFGGSGYDIAAAKTDSPVFYELHNNSPVVEPVALKWDFTEKLFFIYLNKKQDSKTARKQYQNLKVKKSQIARISEISQQLPTIQSLEEFSGLLEEHEEILSEILGIPPVKELFFHDFLGTVKSLGAWGGDFVLATGPDTTKNYFSEKGFQTIFPFKNMIKKFIP